MRVSESRRTRYEEALRAAVKAVMAEDPSLFERGHAQGEVAVTHRIALYLARDLERKKGLFVDVELTRDGEGAKPSPVGRYARPDISVHRRLPTNEGNMVAIEVKWDDENDGKVVNARRKLVEYLAGRLRYRHAALLTIPRCDGPVRLEWIVPGAEASRGGETITLWEMRRPQSRVEEGLGREQRLRAERVAPESPASVHRACSHDRGE